MIVEFTTCLIQKTYFWFKHYILFFSGYNGTLSANSTTIIGGIKQDPGTAVVYLDLPQDFAVSD